MTAADSHGRPLVVILLAALAVACPPDPRPWPCRDSLECPAYAYCDPQLARCRSYDPELGRCGDGTLDLRRGEQCDDGNLIDFDGCSGRCQIEPGAGCGDGAIDYLAGEQCDDGQQCDDGTLCQRNTDCLGIGSGRCLQRAGDGCSAACQIEAPLGCGDGVIDQRSGEVCDDGRQCEDRQPCRDAASCDGVGTGSCAARSGDGCSAACRIEPVSRNCGNGVLDPGERCDNGRTCDDGRSCAVDDNCAGIGDEHCQLRNGDVCDAWASEPYPICRCESPCACNYSCELSATTRHLAGEPGTAGSQDGIGRAARISSSGGPLLMVGAWLYFADAANHCLRSIDPTTGEVRTIAGGRNSERGYLDDTGNGLGARFDLVCPGGGGDGGLTSDGVRLYVGDCGNHVVRSVDLAPPHGVQTLAGRRYVAWDETTTSSCLGKDEQTGLCYLDHADPRQAEFGALNGLAHDRGQIYLVDIAFHTVRRLDLTSGAVTTLVGQRGVSANEQAPSVIDGIGGGALLQEPRCVVADGAGFLYLGERHSLRRVNLRTLETRTIFTGWGSRDGIAPDVSTLFPIALASDGTSVYFAEEVMQVVRQLHLPSGVVTTVAGLPAQDNCSGQYVEGTGNAARFSCVSGLALDPVGRTLFVVDQGNTVIRQIR